MTQVSAGGPRVALPIRVHDLLLSLAGRLDDDALADARELLASAELDRSLEFVAGCLAAGSIPIARGHRRELESLFDQANCDPSVVDRLTVNEAATGTRHRFGGGAIDGVHADQGVAEATRSVLDVLPDVRAVWCVWRLTPAGAVTGPVPHRVVLVGVGPGGFAPATAYRVEHALRRSGIRASVEVLRDGVEPTAYHQNAMSHARQVPLGRPVSSPAAERTPVIQFGERASTRSGSPSFGVEPSRSTPPPAEPARRDTQSIERPRGEKRGTESRSTETRPGESRSRDQPGIDRGTGTRSRADRRASEQPPGKEPAGSESDRGSPTSTPPAWLKERAEPAGAAPTEFNRAASDLDRAAPPSKPPAVAGAPQADFADDALNDQERDLLRQLQEELVRREQAESGTGSSDLGGRHGTRNPFDWPQPSADPTIVNGVPPKQPDQRGRPPA